MATGGRKTQLQVVHTISLALSPTGALTQAQLTAGVQIGVLPAGAVATFSRALTSVAWNGTVSVVANIGTTLLGTQILAASDVRTAAARADTAVPIAAAGPYAVDTPIFASMVFGGTLGTTGATILGLEYWANIG